jgi:hypothetical protein
MFCTSIFIDQEILCILETYIYLSFRTIAAYMRD